MALIKRIDTRAGFVLFCKITLNSNQLRENVNLSPSEQAYIDALSSEKRRCEWLAWHVVLQKYVGRELRTVYNDLGTPVIPDSDYRISVSHSGGYIGLYVAKSSCGIDIDSRGRNFLNVAPRISSPEEMLLADEQNPNDFLSLVWCAKEAVYKYAGVAGLDLIADIAVTEIGADTIFANLRGEPVKLGYFVYDNHNIVYTL